MRPATADKTGNLFAPVRAQVSALLDKFESLDGKARSQDHRRSVAMAIAEALLFARRDAGARRSQSAAASPAPAAPPATWPVTRVKSPGWNGSCRRCKGKAEPGNLVAWDPESGRPSAWQHVSCESPYGDKKARGADK